MQPIDGADANMLEYYKANNIPHTYQCSKCGTYMGVEPPNDPNCTHRWVIRDISKLQNENGNTDETSNRDPKF